jgi:hypothetical protein
VRCISGLAALIVSSVVGGVAVLAQGGGSITGFVTVPTGVKSTDKLIVVACAKVDEMCAKPVAVIALGGKTGLKAKEGLKIPYSFVRLPDDEYTLYALNDLNDNRQHDPDTEELGGYFKPGSFDSILVTPPARDINLELIPLE